MIMYMYIHVARLQVDNAAWFCEEMYAGAMKLYSWV